MFSTLEVPILPWAEACTSCEGQVREMEKLWIDDVIIESVWKKFMSKLLGEWNDLILWVRVTGT